MLEALSRLVKEGIIGRLTVINADVETEEAEKRGVRSVPWLRIGEFVLTGARSYQQLRTWATSSGTNAGRGAYIKELLKNGAMKQALERVQSTPGYLDALIPLIADVDSEFQVRVGVGAILEHLQGTSALAQRVDSLAELARSPDARVRADACHALALTESLAAIGVVESLLNDSSDEVREIAKESLDALKGSGRQA